MRESHAFCVRLGRSVFSKQSDPSLAKTVIISHIFISLTRDEFVLVWLDS